MQVSCASRYLLSQLSSPCLLSSQLCLVFHIIFFDVVAGLLALRCVASVSYTLRLALSTLRF